MEDSLRKDFSRADESLPTFLGLCQTLIRRTWQPVSTTTVGGHQDDDSVTIDQSYEKMSTDNKRALDRNMQQDLTADKHDQQPATSLEDHRRIALILFCREHGWKLAAVD